MDNIVEHMKNIKLLQAVYKKQRFFVECGPMEPGARHFPNTNFAVKEIELPNFHLHEESLGYRWIKIDELAVKPNKEPLCG